MDANFHGFDTLLLEDCTATTSPDFCLQATLHNVRFCFGFTTTIRGADRQRCSAVMGGTPSSGLLNFSVGKCNGADWHRGDSHGVRQAPVREPWIITNDGAEGDQRAVHPDKVYAYARTHYDYWANYLGVEPGNWPDGFFGETSLSTHSMRRASGRRCVCVGCSRCAWSWRARAHPCLKLSWRLGQPQTFQKIFQTLAPYGCLFRCVEQRPGAARRCRGALCAVTPRCPRSPKPAEFAAGSMPTRRSIPCDACSSSSI